MTVHFICRGNAYRSLMAEAYLKSLHLKDVNVISSGTIAHISRQKNEPNIAPLITRLDDYRVGKFVKTHVDQLTQARVDIADINICMNELVAEESKRIVVMLENTITWSVMDSGEGERIIKNGDDEWKYTDEIYNEIRQNIDTLVREKGLMQRN